MLNDLPFQITRVFITGTGDLATACALRLFRAGFRTILLSESHPSDIHYFRNFTRAVLNGQTVIEEIRAVNPAWSLEAGEINEVSPEDFLDYHLANRDLPVLPLSELRQVRIVETDFIFLTSSAHLSGLNPGQLDSMITIGCSSQNPDTGLQYNIEDRLPNAGRVRYPFIEWQVETAASDIIGKTEYIRAPLEGLFTQTAEPGSILHEKQEIGRINQIPILSPYHGYLSGVMNSGCLISAGTVFAGVCREMHPVDPKIIPERYFNIAGALLEVLLFHLSMDRAGKSNG